MNKPRKYHVVVWMCDGEDKAGLPVFYPKYVSAWPEEVVPYKSHYELSPNKKDAMPFGRDRAIEVARTIRMRSCVWSAMVEEA